MSFIETIVPISLRHTSLLITKETSSLSDAAAQPFDLCRISALVSETLVGNLVAVRSDDDDIMRSKSLSVKRTSQPMEENR
jgi:hypothetical protein